MSGVGAILFLIFNVAFKSRIEVGLVHGRDLGIRFI